MIFDILWSGIIDRSQSLGSLLPSRFRSMRSIDLEENVVVLVFILVVSFGEILLEDILTPRGIFVLAGFFGGMLLLLVDEDGFVL